MKRALLALALALALAGCAGGPDPNAPRGGIGEVVVVLKGSDEPLPFDPRGGRLTVVTQEIARLVGHPIVLELDASLSPELKASLEETVLASFETLARELVLIQKDDPAMFEQAKKIDRVVCKYDAVAKESSGALQESGKHLVVRSPPERFPLLEPWILTRIVYGAHIEELDARWGEVDPTRLSPREQAAWFDYMTTTRAGAGYVWTAKRAKQGPLGWDDLRVEHVGRVAKLALVIGKESPIWKDVNDFMLGNARLVGGLAAKPPSPGMKVDPSRARQVAQLYEKWLVQRVASFDDSERHRLAREVLERRSGCNDCSPEAVFPSFDRFAFGLSIYDAWVKDKAPLEGPPGPKGELYKSVVCPHKPRGEAETEILYGCGAFFWTTLRDEADRARLGATIVQRRDSRLLDNALLNLPYDGGGTVVELVESLKDDGLQRHGFSVLFHDLARRGDVKTALEKAAPRWWRDVPARRGFALLVMARQWEDMHPHYGDNQWRRFVAEFGGPIGHELLASFLREGARAAEMLPKMWVALEKTGPRDDEVAKAIASLLERDRLERSARAGPALVLLRARYCAEKNDAGFGKVRAALDLWAASHPADAAAASQARADFTLARCKPGSEGAESM